jgi:hypothetical protein
MRKRDKANEGREYIPDPHAVNSLEQDASEHRAPADENGRRIQISNRGTTFQRHAVYQAERVHRTCQEDQEERATGVATRT